MISRLRGELIEKNLATCVVDCGGVGYEVSVPETVTLQLPSLGDRVDLYVRQVFREDGVSLYGFLSSADRELFDKLQDVKGCGPKVSLALLGQVGAASVVAAILGGDTRTLSKASGVGARLADRMVLELKDKVAGIDLPAAKAVIPVAKRNPGDDDVIESLLVLGVKKAEAEWAIEQVGAEGSVQDRIKACLSLLRG